MSVTEVPHSRPAIVPVIELDPTRRERTRPTAREWAVDRRLLAALGALTLCALALRLRGLGAALWLDEAQAVTIARHPASQIPSLLQLDGSPPLYYLLLHAWIRVFGAGDMAVHVLSVLIAAACVPAGFVTGRLIAGRRAGWIVACMLATSSFLSQYAGQARMYTLVVLLALVVMATFVAAFVHRRRAFVPVFSVVLALALYAHNWALFLAAGCAAGIVTCWWSEGRSRRTLFDGAAGLGLAAALYAPWIPRLLDQMAHTGAPWSVHPTAGAVFGALGASVGPAAAAVIVLLVGGAGAVTLVRRAHPTRERLAVVALLVTCATTLVAGVIFCEIALAWAPRYLAVLAAPLLVLGGVGFGAIGRLGLGAAVLTIAITASQPTAQALENKTNVARMSYVFNHRLRPHDLVVATQPEQRPALARYLRPGLSYADAFGPVAAKAVIDWRDAPQRLQKATVGHVLEPLIARMKPGEQVLLVTPVTRAEGTAGEWGQMVTERAQQWSAALSADPRLRRVAVYRGDWNAAIAVVAGELYVRR